MDLTIELFGTSYGHPSPALVIIALLFGITFFAFAEFVSEMRDDPRILFGTVFGMSVCAWLIEIHSPDGRPSFVTFVVESVLGAGLFGALAMGAILLSRLSRYGVRALPRTLLGAPRGL
jgi:hypothetical protein